MTNFREHMIEDRWEERESEARDDIAQGRADHIEALKRRAIELASKQEHQPAGQHIGTRGERQEFTGTVKLVKDFKKEIEGQEVVSHLTLIETEDGATIKYWNLLRHRPKGGIPSEIGEGIKVSFRATVAAHEEYKGTKQTLVQRAHVTKIYE